MIQVGDFVRLKNDITRSVLNEHGIDDAYKALSFQDMIFVVVDIDIFTYEEYYLIPVDSTDGTDYELLKDWWYIASRCEKIPKGQVIENYHNAIQNVFLTAFYIRDLYEPDEIILGRGFVYHKCNNVVYAITKDKGFYGVSYCEWDDSCSNHDMSAKKYLMKNLFKSNEFLKEIRH